jgi:hypothetical protein
MYICFDHVHAFALTVTENVHITYMHSAASTHRAYAFMEILEQWTKQTNPVCQNQIYRVHSVHTVFMLLLICVQVLYTCCPHYSLHNPHSRVRLAGRQKQINRFVTKYSAYPNVGNSKHSCLPTILTSFCPLLSHSPAHVFCLSPLQYVASSIYDNFSSVFPYSFRTVTLLFVITADY